MNSEAQRIAIAEACGWTNVHGGEADGGLYLRGYEPDYRGGLAKAVPLYLTDLNAMHEAEKVLNTPVHMQKHAWNNYKALLEKTTDGSSFHATAAQRAEAFLRTLNKWEQ